MSLNSFRLRIRAVSLNKLLDVIDCVIIGIKEISVRYRCADKVIGSSVFNILLGVFYLDVYHL